MGASHKPDCLLHGKSTVNQSSYLSSLQPVDNQFKTDLAAFPKLWPKEMQFMQPLFSSFLTLTCKQVRDSQDKLSDLLGTIQDIVRAEDDLRKLVDAFKANVESV